MSDSEQTKVSDPYASHFSLLPHLANYELSLYEHRLYCHILFRAGNGGEFWEKVETTAIYCNMSEAKVREARDSLKAKGYIKVEDEGREGRTLLITPANLWQRNQTTAKNPPTLAEIYEAQTGKPYEERGKHHQELGKLSAQKRASTPNGYVTPNAHVTPTSNAGVTPTPNAHVTRTILPQQNYNNNNTLSEASSEGVTPSEHNSSTEAEKALQSKGKPRQPKPAKGEVAPRPAKAPDWQARPWLYARDPVPTDNYLALSPKDKNTALLAMICWYVSNNKPSTEEDVYKRVGKGWESKVLAEVKMVNGGNPESLMRWAKEYRANPYGSATLSAPILAQRYAQWLAGNQQITQATTPTKSRDMIELEVMLGW